MSASFAFQEQERSYRRVSKPIRFKTTTTPKWVGSIPGPGDREQHREEDEHRRHGVHDTPQEEKEQVHDEQEPTQPTPSN
jgi:hypothetical protein